MIIGTQEIVDKTKNKLMTYLKCEDCGEMEECVGNRLTRLGRQGTDIHPRCVNTRFQGQV